MRYRYLAAVLMATCLMGCTMQAKERPMGNWPAGKTYTLDGLTVEVSAPVLIGRDKEEFWYPQVLRAPNGQVIALVRAGGDKIAEDDQFILWSDDGGLTWGRPQRFAGQSFCALPLPSGDFALLPYHFGFSPDGIQGRANMVRTRQRQIEPQAHDVSVTGFPRPVGRIRWEGTTRGLDANICFDGQPVRLTDGTWLATLYGSIGGDQVRYEHTHFFGEDGRLKRYSLLAAESRDGVHWRIRSTIAGEDCPLKGNECEVINFADKEYVTRAMAGDEGPCEASLCRLRDGRLMCVFRLHGCAYFAPYGQTFSSDEGRTWTSPRPMNGTRSVEPSLAVLDKGVVLSGGRPDLYLWINAAGDGEQWQTVDLLAHHNACHPAEPIRRLLGPGPRTGAYGYGTSTSYTELAIVDADTLLCVYDRTPLTFPKPPADSDDPRETYSCWIVRISLKGR